jgi:retinaldehyde-binding protein 1
MWPLEPSPPMSNLRCLPTHDPFGRPILVINAIPLDKDTKLQKRFIIKAFEQLRIYLKVLYDGKKDVREPTLQYVALLDLGQLSLQSVVRNSYVKAFFHSNVTITSEY